MRISAALPLFLLPLSACPTGEPTKTKTPEDFGTATVGDEPVPIGTAKKKDDHKNDAPEISRSRGPKGGVVVLWPRVWPHPDDAATKDLAVKVQQRLEALSKRAAGARSVELRPEPERSCQKEGGCEATSVSAVIVVRDKACAAVAVVAGPGTSPAHLLPWAGKVTFTKDTVPFRDAPEELVKVTDHVPCDKLLEGVEQNEAAIARYITGLLPGG